MDIRLAKLKLSLWIMVPGMLIAVVWAGWQGWGLGRGYPYNNFLYVGESHFSDFTSVVKYSGTACPYEQEFAFYFPATYLIFYPLTELNATATLLGFLLSNLLLFVLLQRYVFLDFLHSRVKATSAALLLTASSHALVLCVDRGNIELMMAVLLGIALLAARRCHFYLAGLLIGITACLKLYTILLLALFIRRKHFRFIVIPVLACMAASIVSLMTFSHPIRESLDLWQGNLRQYNFFYVIFDRGMAGSASPWNLFKIIVLTIDHFHLTTLHLNRLLDGQHFASFFLIASQIYNRLFLIAVWIAIAFVTFIEAEFFRRAIFLLLVVTISSQAGADYKLLYIHIALVLLIALRSFRPKDLWIIAMLAVVLVPKKEVLLDYLGPTDTTFNDVNLGDVLNPLLILTVLAFLVHDGWKRRIPGSAATRAKGMILQVMQMNPLRGSLAR